MRLLIVLFAVLMAAAPASARDSVVLIPNSAGEQASPELVKKTFDNCNNQRIEAGIPRIEAWSYKMFMQMCFDRAASGSRMFFLPNLKNTGENASAPVALETYEVASAVCKTYLDRRAQAVSAAYKDLSPDVSPGFIRYAIIIDSVSRFIDCINAEMR